jgi:hypothetical protein
MSAVAGGTTGFSWGVTLLSDVTGIEISSLTPFVLGQAVSVSSCRTRTCVGAADPRVVYPNTGKRLMIDLLKLSQTPCVVQSKT